MYESKFGLSGPPFQLNPDPAFYFDSRGHSNALSYLKFGVHQGEGFIVVTGEIGAGKTTLVRTLLEGVNSDEVVAAQVLNTQLESGELLQAILTAFGVASPSGSKAHLLASLEAFLTAVAADGRRALLIVDEAQNLGREAIEELRMLSNFQLGNHALLQSFLVGQPELRKQLESPAMEQLRQRVIASCHLGPLSDDETKSYVEHRLRHVGWTEVPRFDVGAFEAIYRWTGGIPRKINLLCNRLLLATYLAELDCISAQLVEETGGEQARETGGQRALQPAAFVPRAPMPVVPALAEAGAVALPAATNARLMLVARRKADLRELASPILCLADDPLGVLEAAAIAQALQSTESGADVLLVNPGQLLDVECDRLPAALMQHLALETHLDVAAGSGAQMLPAVAARFGHLLDLVSPSVVLSMGSSDSTLLCHLLARKRVQRLARLDAGRRRDGQSSAYDLNSILMDRMSDVLYTPMLKTHYTLYREGLPADRMVCIGSMARDGLQLLAPQFSIVSDQLKAVGLNREQLRRAMRGYVLATAQFAPGDLDRSVGLPQFAKVLRELGRQTLTIWLVTESTVEAIAAAGIDQWLKKSGVVLVPSYDYLTRLSLLRGAVCVIAGPGWCLVEESDSLDIPSIVLYPQGDIPQRAPDGAIATIPCDASSCVRALHDILNRGRPADEQQSPDAGAATTRLLNHLASWVEPPSKRRRPAATDMAA
jgi:putative secretion ATPase (PEP-CTERM system associated)